VNTLIENKELVETDPSKMAKTAPRNEEVGLTKGETKKERKGPPLFFAVLCALGFAVACKPTS